MRIWIKERMAIKRVRGMRIRIKERMAIKRVRGMKMRTCVE